MSAALDLLNDLSRGGVVLYLKDGKLKYQADPGAYTDERRALVAANREALIAELKALTLGGPANGVRGEKSLGPAAYQALVRPTPYWRRRWAEDEDLRRLYGLQEGG